MIVRGEHTVRKRGLTVAQHRQTERRLQRVSFLSIGVELLQARRVAARANSASAASISAQNEQLSRLSSTAAPEKTSRHSDSAERSGACTSAAYGAVSVLSWAEASASGAAQ